MITTNQLNEILIGANDKARKNDDRPSSYSEVHYCSYNPVIVQEIITRLIESEKCISFYANQDNWMGYHRDCTYISNDDVKTKASDDFDIIIGGKRAREYQSKYMKGE